MKSLSELEAERDERTTFGLEIESEENQSYQEEESYWGEEW